MKVNLLYFLLSTLITFIFLYLYNSTPQIILKYPNHKNKISDLYIDDKNVCYRYETKDIQCPMN